MQAIQTARIVREFPSATKQLPSPALASANGGTFALDPSDKDEKTTLLPFFSVDVEVPPDLVRDRWGQRAWLRFDHGPSPLVLRWWRAARQVFLGRFHV
jgi:putative peptide zinc metalloprotease protein